jgi:hypothetical protein
MYNSFYKFIKQKRTKKTMSEHTSPWGTPSELAPLAKTEAPSPFHQESLAETLPEPARRRFGDRIARMFTKRPESVVGDMSNSLHNVNRLGNYRSEGLDNLTDGGLEKTGQYDHSREEILGALQGEAQIEDGLRENAIAQKQAEFFQLESQKPGLADERSALEAKMVDAESITLTQAQTAALRQQNK